MARLEIETRNCINSYYSNIIKPLKEKKERFIENYKKEKVEEFYNSEIVKDIKEDFTLLKTMFPELDMKLSCDVYSYGSSYRYDDKKEYKEIVKEIEQIENERRKLIVTLESNSKNSNEFKKAMKNFILKMEKEEK